jgi:hypothetical protein
VPKNRGQHLIIKKEIVGVAREIDCLQYLAREGAVTGMISRPLFRKGIRYAWKSAAWSPGQAVGKVGESLACAGGNPSKSVGAPVFATDTMTHEKKTLGIVFFLDGAEARVVLPPKGELP